MSAGLHRRLPGSGALGSGGITAGALAVQQGAAALVGVVIARELGRGAETDGFFAAYGVFIVIALAATASRSVLLPPLARARVEHRLGSETATYAVVLALLAVPVVILAIVFEGGIASLLTGFDEGVARETAASVLPWLVAAGVFQLYAGLSASALAALDDYVAAAAGFTLGPVLGLGLILWRVGPDGVEAVAWGMALNGAVVLGIPAVVLVLRARREGMPLGAARPADGGRRRRLGDLGGGVALPLALQAVYLVCLPFAAGEGVGTVTSLGYAYLAGSAVIAVTASALALVTSVPLTRSGLDPERVARHVRSAAWIALLAVGFTAGVFGVAGESLADAVLGNAYGADIGQELGHIVVALTPWMLVAVGVSIAFPLVFVERRNARLPLVALLVLAVSFPLTWLGSVVAGVYGLAVALAIATGVGLFALLHLLDSVGPTLRGLAGAALTIAALTVAAFVPPALVLEPTPAGAAGAVVYVVLLALLRPKGLRDAWDYLRALR